MAGLKSSLRFAFERVVDACAGHDRQAVRAIGFSPSGTLTGVLAHDPIVWSETSTGGVSALCELETDGRFDPNLVLFSADRTMVLAGHPGELQMYDVATGSRRWRLAVPWWEVFELDPATLVCVEYERGSEAFVSLVDVRSGAVRSRVAIDRSMDPPTAVVERGAPRVFGASTILPVEPGRTWRAAPAVLPTFSLDPNAHARLWPTKVAGGELFLALNYAGGIVHGFASLRGGRSWRPERSATMLATLDDGRVLVGGRDQIPAGFALIDGVTGKELLALRLPTEQAEAIVCAAVDASETRLALGTTLGRVLVLALQTPPAR